MQNRGCRDTHILQLGWFNRGDFELPLCFSNCEIGELWRKTGRETRLYMAMIFLFFAIMCMFLRRGTITTSSWFYVKPRPVTALVLLFLNLLLSQNTYNALTDWVAIFKIWSMSSRAEKTSSNDIGKDGFTLLFLLIQWVYTTMSTINLVATF